MKGPIVLMERCGVDDSLIGDLIDVSAGAWSPVSLATGDGRDRRCLRPRSRGAPNHRPPRRMIGIVLLDASRFPLEWTWDRLRSPFIETMSYLELRHLAGIVSGIVRTILVSPLQFGVGWLVVRANRVHTPIAIVSILAILWLLAAPELMRLGTNWVDQPRFRSYLAVMTIGMLAVSFSLVAGGLKAMSAPDPVRFTIVK